MSPAPGVVHGHEGHAATHWRGVAGATWPLLKLLVGVVAYVRVVVDRVGCVVVPSLLQSESGS
jgi:hypothetical protein